MLSCNKGKLGFRNFIELFPKYNPIISCSLTANEAKILVCTGTSAITTRSCECWNTIERDEWDIMN